MLTLSEKRRKRARGKSLVRNRTQDIFLYYLNDFIDSKALHLLENKANKTSQLKQLFLSSLFI